MTGGELLAGRYEMRGLLGRGGMAEVHDGWDSRLCRPVAIKVLHPAFTTDPDLRRRFEVEARAAAALAHPNVVAVHDFGEHAGSPFIIMERLPGRTLHDVMGAGPMSPHQVRAALDDVLAGLSAAHAAGVLHRDIKPGNILLSASGDRMKVADFGIAKTGGAAETKTGQIIGTMCYMSPERVMGGPASVADDLYAVAVIGYEALLGQRAFPHDHPVALARAIIDTPPPPLSVRRTDVDPALAGVIDRGMARDPAHRFGSAEQMRAALAGDPAALMGGPVPAPAVPGRPSTRVMAAPLPPTAGYSAPPPRPIRRKNPRRYLLAAAAIVAAFVVSALALALDPFATSPSPASVSTSTSVPPPTTSIAPPPPPAPSPVVQQPEPAPPQYAPGPGNGHGNGKGNGDKKKKG